jgi:hypothetical protein
MKIQFHWRGVGIWLALCISTLALLTSCGGGKANLGGDSQQVSTNPVGGAVTGESRTITEDEISSLPAWQQDLLADPGWNQPPITPRADTPMPAPSHELLLEWQAKAQAAGIESGARAAEGKGSSHVGGFQPTGALNRGEYNIPFAPLPATVPYGCRDTGGTGQPIHMKEKKLAAEPIPIGANQAITFVEKGITASNHFNTTGGASNNALCAVYQIWSSNRNANPATTAYSASAPQFAEVSYRADGGPGANGDPCNAVKAYTVREFIWWKYNQQNFNALPGMNSTPLYNILVAPSSDLIGPGTSPAPNSTVGRIQHFYCGNLSSVYGGGAIVSIESSGSSCATFKDSIANNRLFYTNPIYGVLLKRWQDSVVKSMVAPNNNPWNGDFGWPVQGPTAFNNGASVLTGNGAYYAWGMYFERGFMWWIDYINNANVPDEAQAYGYTGTNVFCKGKTDVYEKLPTIYYGGTGALGVSVVVEASLNPDRGPGSPPAGTYYEVGNPASPTPALVLDMHAHGYGGTPRASDGRYKHYTWAFRDGTIGVTNGVAFDDTTKYVQHSYVTESVYTIRVQVVDGNNLVAYGDSLPIHVGTGGAAGGGPNSGQVWLVRADDATNDGSFGDFPAGYDAVKTALDDKGATVVEREFSASIVSDFQGDAAAKVMIFYRGGPGAAGEPSPFTAPFPTDQQNAIKSVLSTGTKRRVLFIGQGQAYTNQPISNNTWSRSDLGFTCTQVAANSTNGVADIGNWGVGTVGNGRGLNGSFWQSVGSDTSEYWPLMNYQGAIKVGFANAFSAQAAERYVSAGSSGKTPLAVSVAARQFTSGCDYNGFDTLGWWQVSTGWKQGMHATNASGGSLGFMPGYVNVSQGSSSAPGMTNGTGKIWCWQFSFSDMTVTSPAGMNKADLLQNVLAWLDSSLTFSAKTNGGFQEYAGAPQIVSVTPAYWDEANHQYVTGGQTAPWDGTGNSNGRGPDQTMANVYRTTPGTPANAIITSDPNNDWINGNDLDFAQTMYAYIDRGANITLETGGVGPAWNNTDDTVFYAGFLAADPDGSWQRIANPATTPSIMLMEAANNVMSRSPIPVVTGYYQSTGNGNTVDDVYANYGTNVDAFTATASSWSNANALTVECLARWPQTLKYFNWTGQGGQAPNAPDAYLVWQLFPGQGNRIPTGPNAGKFISLNADWEESRREFDVDTANGWTVPGRVGNSWNRPSFSFQDPATQGRAISFNFRKIGTWNGDQNRDGVFNVADKFPVRVRLFTDHQAYYNKTLATGAPGWPNHLANPGADPATTPVASRNPSYLEGVTYVVDKGTPVYPVQISDDPNAANPGAPGTISGQGPGSYTARLQFLLKYGTPDYRIEADTWYTGSWGVNNGVATVMVKDFPTAPNTQGAKDYTINVPAAQPNGNYNFAIRVTDDNGDVSTYVWPGTVGLFPTQLFQDDFNNFNNWTQTIPMGTNQGGGQWSNLTSVTNQLPSIATIVGHGGSGGFASPTPGGSVSYANRYNRALELTNSINVPAGTGFTMSFYTAGCAETGWDGLLCQVSFDDGSTWEGHTTGYWTNQGANANAFSNSSYNGITIGTVACFTNSISTTGTGNSWVSHTRTYPPSGVARQMKIRYWFASDSSVVRYPGVLVDSLLLQ